MTLPSLSPPHANSTPSRLGRALMVPDDVVAQIISHTDTDTFFTAQSVSRSWQDLSCSASQLQRRVRAYGYFVSDGLDASGLQRQLQKCHRTQHNLTHNKGTTHHPHRKSPNYFGQVFMGDKMFQLVDVQAELSRLEWPAEIEDPLVGFLEPIKAARDPALEAEVPLDAIRTPFALQRHPFEQLFMPVPQLLTRGPEHLVCIGKDMRLQACMDYFDPQTLLVLQQDAPLPLRRFAMHSPIKRVHITPDGRHVAASLTDGAWVCAPGQPDARAFFVHVPALVRAELSMDGSRLAAISHHTGGGSIFDFWDVRLRTHIRSRRSELTFETAALGHLTSFDARAELLAAVSDCGSLCLFHTTRASLDVCRYSSPEVAWRITALQFAPFDDLLALGDSSGSATVVALQGWRQVAALPRGRLAGGWIRHVGFNAEGTLLVAENSRGECVYKDFSARRDPWDVGRFARWAKSTLPSPRDAWPHLVLAAAALMGAGWMLSRAQRLEPFEATA